MNRLLVLRLEEIRGFFYTCPTCKEPHYFERDKAGKFNLLGKQCLAEGGGEIFPDREGRRDLALALERILNAEGVAQKYDLRLAIEELPKT